MSKIVYLLLITIITLKVGTLSSQENLLIPPNALEILERRGEIYFSFEMKNKDNLKDLSKVISIDAVTDTGIVAYANTEEFLSFLQYRLPFTIHRSPGESATGIRMASTDNLESIKAWDVYPTYDAYLAMMNQFAIDYPNLCQVFSIGSSTNGRQLMMAKISDHVTQTEAEPRFLYTSSIHGDELTGFVLMLRLIDYLLVNYGTSPKVTNLVDNIEIWINPLANPDGTYKTGNHTVSGAVRYNANNVDLNRNYHDPDDGLHPDGKVWQPETLAFMQMAEDYKFVMGANFHGGAEVLNYPWDTWSRLHADNAWWIYVCREYVDTVHQYAPAGYLDDLNNGITNGYAWYTITGGRQDYMNYFHHCRELTLEISTTKLPAASTLPNYWNYNYRSLLNYMEQCLYGVRGIVTDSAGGQPLYSKVFIENHDIDNSFVYSLLPNGNYHRPLYSGNYSFTFTADGHPPLTFHNIQAVNRQTLFFNVSPGTGSLEPIFEATAVQVPAGGEIQFRDLSYGAPVSWSWTFNGAIPEVSHEQNPVVRFPESGAFTVTLTVSDAAGNTETLTKTGYITVSSDYKMRTGTFYTCTGNFYDSGGSGANYTNGEDYTITFKPCVPAGKVKVQFTAFNVETQSSCNNDYLLVYNGESTSAPLVGKYCGTTSPGTVTASGSSGALTFRFVSNASTNRAGWAANISCQASQTVEIPAGWSGLSGFIIPVNSDIQQVMQPVQTELVLIQNFEGVYYPDGGINTLDSWDTYSGYVIKLTDTASLTIAGSPLLDRTHSLNSGWNLMPYNNWCSMDCELFDQKTGGHLQAVLEVAGNAVYWPAMGINSLGEMIPGKSYFVRVDADVAVELPNCP